MISNPVQVFLHHTARMGESYYYYFGGLKKVLISSDPDVLRHILKDNYTNYPKSTIQIDRMGHFLGPGLLTSHGDYWRQQRRLIQRGFHASTLATLGPIMHASLEESLSRFNATVHQGALDLCSWMMSLTFSMVARSLFSARMTDDEIQLISDTITKIQTFLVRQIVRPYLAPWVAVSGEFGRHEAMRERGDAILLRHIRSRRAQPGNEGDLLQILLGALNCDTGQGMSDAQVLCESMQILVAGHETSSTALAWTLYLLCRHPDYLQRARDEFNSVVGNARLTSSHIPQLKLNTHILEEALRIYPPFWMVDRVAINEDRVKDIEIARGTTIIAFIYGAHHAARHWTDPESFRPERFDEDAQQINRGFTYLPFGAGARGCIGANYAMLQMLMILSAILRRYEFSLISDHAVETHPMIILRARGGIWVRIRPVEAEQS